MDMIIPASWNFPKNPSQALTTTCILSKNKISPETFSFRGDWS